MREVFSVAGEGIIDPSTGEGVIGAEVTVREDGRSFSVLVVHPLGGYIWREDDFTSEAEAIDRAKLLAGASAVGTAIKLTFSPECDGDAQAMVLSAVRGWNVRVNGQDVQVEEVGPEGFVCVDMDDDPVARTVSTRMFTWEAINDLHIY